MYPPEFDGDELKIFLFRAGDDPEFTCKQRVEYLGSPLEMAENFEHSLPHLAEQILIFFLLLLLEWLKVVKRYVMLLVMVIQWCFITHPFSLILLVVFLSFLLINLG